MSSNTADAAGERRSTRVTRRSFLFKAVSVSGASAVLMLAQACREGGAAPSYGPSGGQQPAPPAATQAAAAPAGTGSCCRRSSGQQAGRCRAGQPKMGGILISAVTAEPPTLDPHLGFPATWTSLMYDYLVYFDKENKVQPNLAESWEIQNDGATIVFKLRKGVKFHNGRELVADDVKYSMERLQDQKSVFAR